MSSKPKNAHGDYEYLRSAIKEKEVLEDEHDVLVTATIRLCGSPCSLRIRLEAWDKDQSPATQAPLCSYEVHWPNAGTLSWPATVFNAYVRLSRLVEDCRRDEWADTLRAQRGG